MKAEEIRADYAVIGRPENGIGTVPFAEVTEPKVDQGGPSAAGEFTYIDISSIDNKLKRITECKALAVEAAPSRAKQRLKTGDVLVSMTRPNLNAVAIVPPDLDGAVGSTGFHVLRATEGTEPRWLYYAVQTHGFIFAMTELVQGALYPAVRPKDIRAFEIPHPPLDQQKRIVAEIEKQFSRLDEAVANLKRVKANLKRYKAAVLKAAVEGKLTEAWRKQHRDTEPASELLQRILAERRAKWEQAELAKMQAKDKTPRDDAWKKKYPEPAAPDTSGLPELPEGWVWVSLDNLIVDGPQNGLYLPKLLYGSGHPILRIDDYQQDWMRPVSELQLVRAKPEDIATYSLRYGDIVINRVNSPSHLGKVAIWVTKTASPLFESNMMRASLSSSIVPLYVAMYLRSLDGRERLTKQAKWAVNQASINQQDVCATQVPLPPLAEQHYITAEVERCLSLADEAETQVNANLQRAERLRQSVLASAFTPPVKEFAEPTLYANREQRAAS